jgi:hypothetical protein
VSWQIWGLGSGRDKEVPASEMYVLTLGPAQPSSGCLLAGLAAWFVATHPPASADVRNESSYATPLPLYIFKAWEITNFVQRPVCRFWGSFKCNEYTTKHFFFPAYLGPVSLSVEQQTSVCS